MPTLVDGEDASLATAGEPDGYLCDRRLAIYDHKVANQGLV